MRQPKCHDPNMWDHPVPIEGVSFSWRCTLLFSTSQLEPSKVRLSCTAGSTWLDPNALLGSHVWGCTTSAAHERAERGALLPPRDARAHVCGCLVHGRGNSKELKCASGEVYRDKSGRARKSKRSLRICDSTVWAACRVRDSLVRATVHGSH